MSAVPVFTIYCDGGGCRSSFAAEAVRSTTAADARRGAAGAGWTRARRGGRLGDLCPTCSVRAA